MKPVLHTDKNIISNLQGRKIPMRFHEESLPQLMRRFIDLYEDRTMAVLREYACNARDSHIAAGVTAPIEVLLPNRLNPTLTIRDHGLGMSVEDLEEIWSAYGASTKLESNEAIGSFGLGSKSALTYTDQFTVQAVKDGIEALVSISFNDDGIGELTVVIEQETDKPNGVEIVIPSSWPNTFAEKAQELFQWWPEGSVLVDGEQPQSFMERGSTPREVAPDIYLQEVAGGYYDQTQKSVLVMGGVPYPVTIADLGLNFSSAYRNRTQRVIAFVDIGTVEPVPAREGLTDTPANTEAMLAIGKEVRKNAARVAQETIDQAGDLYEAIQTIETIQGAMPQVLWPEHKPWIWQGQEVPETVESPDTIEVTQTGEWGESKRKKGGFVLVHRHGKGKQHQRIGGLNWTQIQTVLYFKGFDLDTFTPSHRNRLKQWFINNADRVHSSPDYVVLCDNLPDSPLIKHERVYDWDEVRATKLPRRFNTDRGRLIGSYDNVGLSLSHATEITAEDIDDDEPVYYFLEQETKNPRYESTRAQKARPYVQYLKQLHPDATFVAFAENRRDKFLRMFPEAKEMRAAIREQRDRFAKRLTDDKKTALHLRGIGRPYHVLEGAILVDPDLSRAAKLMKLDVSAEEQARNEFAQLNLSVDISTDFDPLANYPLVENIGRVYSPADELKQHITVYLNSAYSTIVRSK